MYVLQAEKQEKANAECLSKLAFHISVNLNGFVDQQEKTCVHEHICGIDHWDFPWPHLRLQNGIGGQDEARECGLCRWNIGSNDNGQCKAEATE